ncbi:Hypothetical protein SCF082_LOCUS8538 [Durusdinium trenchii]|uniref:Uncharacterized protein n=1 Tax=Durusdinium trenchii TaxID=1381693 RepID=A0ABP0ISF4_9DINO
MAEEVAAKLDILAAKVETLSLEKKWEPMDYPPDRIEHVRKSFEEHPKGQTVDGKKTLELKFLHQVLFTEEERKEYALKDFESDAAAVLKDASSLSWEDVEKFMAENL